MEVASRTAIFEAAKAAVRNEVLSHRPRQRIWTAVKPSSFGLDADGWLLWSRRMIVRFNDVGMKAPIAIEDDDQRDFVDKVLLDFAKALRDA